MNLKKGVCNRKLAEKLEKLRVKQESYFWWIVKGKEEELFINESKEMWLRDYDHQCPSKFYSAFTVAELGEMLPDLFCSGKHTKGYICNLVNGDIKLADTEADARAKTLIETIETGHFKGAEFMLDSDLEKKEFWYDDIDQEWVCPFCGAGFESEDQPTQCPDCDEKVKEVREKK